MTTIGVGLSSVDYLVSNEVTEAIDVTTVGAELSAVRAELPDYLVSNEVTEAIDVTTVGAGCHLWGRSYLIIL